MSFSVTGAHICVVFFFLISSLRQGLVAGLWILLATRVTWFNLPGVGLLANNRVVLGT